MGGKASKENEAQSKAPVSNKNKKTSEVKLYCYDLSEGQMKQYSIPLKMIGACDFVPHTAIVVFGTEYFYGGGAGIS